MLSRSRNAHDGGRAMASAPVAKGSSPMLATDNMDEAISFYQSVLGFVPTLHTWAYCFLERDGQTIHFQNAASEEVMKCFRGHAEIYIEVRGIARL
jgi:catechol 2,3-dioxygenase-like lactoylglutathione lyase family enzyme